MAGSVFIVPVGASPEAARNYEETIVGRVPIEQIGPIEAAPDTLEDELPEQVAVWGCRSTRKGTWAKLEANDLALFLFGGQFTAAGWVIGKKRDPDLAEALWEDRDFELTYCLHPIEFTQISREVGLRILGYPKAKTYSPRGFNRVDRDLDPKHVASLIGLESEKTALAMKQADLVAGNYVSEGTEADLDRTVAEVVAVLEGSSIPLGGETPDQLAKRFGHLLGNEPKKVKEMAERFKRSAELRDAVHKLYNGQCQICGFSFEKNSGGNYGEVAHMLALGDGGTDELQNVLCLCPNHHKMLDFGALRVGFVGDVLVANIDPASGELLDDGWIEIKNKHLKPTEELSFSSN